jgi:hypothetical protein
LFFLSAIVVPGSSTRRRRLPGRGH